MCRLVTAKQPNSKMCLVCGLKNAFGLRSFFYELDNNDLLAIFKPLEEHQGYPNRLHGGIATAVLDETVGRAIMIAYSEDVWGVTIEFTTRYKRPIPLDSELRVVGRVTRDTKRHFEGSGEIMLADGSIAAAGYGKYLKLPIGKIADFDLAAQEWQVVPSEDDPAEVDL
jgi:acyl-coenzyme A thioesterase PaaI-like protein